ncbi:MmcQ/YjbR family DNA-binding protein [Burkholderia multivorans]|uniref:MmcQ/YjbR family DNA-binding protein n=1 Tax=Burkholderia multivorans TaxID=87883 RepID=UPI001902F451|nr:MmcQ/YjbR family DNA-binding protein [Burkholderia multivorans]MBJ9940338.1 MmcQ/YjbR family DNA-binding protein [Burkholderia multivorans]MBU9289342.1 MmcQ/YjbR family DNA-binding protein [Burkholderia multivorans]MDN7945240.1 MmcQ/YjbR family DNA-binding protein [Burkholderia multivorans]
MTFDEVRQIVLAWRGVEEGTSYGTPALKVRRKMLARLREDGDTLVVKGVDPDERAWLIESEPDVYYVTDHYVGWPIVLVRLSAASPEAVTNLLRREWEAIVPAKWREAGDAS